MKFGLGLDSAPHLNDAFDSRRANRYLAVCYNRGQNKQRNRDKAHFLYFSAQIQLENDRKSAVCLRWQN